MKQAIRFDYEAHYHLSQEPTFGEQELWLVMHGYGQLAEFFVRKFKPFFSPERLFVAPEGTNYNYLEGFQGRVGANWMTKHERETAIANNHRMLDSLMGALLGNYAEKPRIRVLGFSQGAATASRWASHWEGKIATLVLWAGGFALDLNLEEAREAFADTELVLALGDTDDLISPDQVQQQKALVSSLERDVVSLSYPGGHELDPALLEKIINRKK